MGRKVGMDMRPVAISMLCKCMTVISSSMNGERNILNCISKWMGLKGLAKIKQEKCSLDFE